MPDTAFLLEISYQLSNIIKVVLCLTSILILFKWKRIPTAIQYLGIYLIWNLVIEIIADFYVQTYHNNNLPFLHLYTLGEFILLSLFYNSIFSKAEPSKSPKTFTLNTLTIYMVIGISLIIFNSTYLQAITIYNSYAKTFVQVSIIAYAVVYFYNLSNQENLSSVLEKSLRLINSALMVYYSGSLFIFMFGNYYQSNQQVYAMFWLFNGVLNLLFQLAVLYAIWKIAFKDPKLSI